MGDSVDLLIAQAMAGAALVVSVISSLGLFALNTEARNSSQDNRVMVCNITRLVSHVPAIQFENEPRANFIGWIESRRDMLEAIHHRKICLKDEKLLRARVKLDQQLLEVMQRDTNHGR